MRFLILIQIVFYFFILGFLLSRNFSLFLIFKTTFNAGPPHRGLYDANNQSLISRSVFMSCNRQQMYNPFWSIISSLNPTTILWMGDNIYGDFLGSSPDVVVSVVQNILYNPLHAVRAYVFKSVSLFPPATPASIQDGYSKIRNHPEYKKILAGKNLKLVTGTYDDHDYGVNDGDKTFPHKIISKSFFLDFLSVPDDDRRRIQDGVYDLHYIDHTLESGRNFRTGFIVLDTRYNKDPYSITTGDFLGHTQWDWLQNVLNNSTADVNIIVSSIQVLGDERFFLESWSKFPHARRRLLNTILNSGIRSPIILSGDVHFAEISTAVCRPENGTNEVQLWEFTSSGMTHAARRTKIIGIFADFILRWIFPTGYTDSIDGLAQMYTGKNIGVIDITENDLTLRIKILNSLGQIVLYKDLILNKTETFQTTDIWDCIPIEGRSSTYVKPLILIMLIIGSSLTFISIIGAVTKIVFRQLYVQRQKIE